MPKRASCQRQACLNRRKQEDYQQVQISGALTVWREIHSLIIYRTTDEKLPVMRCLQRIHKCIARKGDSFKDLPGSVKLSFDTH